MGLNTILVEIEDSSEVEEVDTEIKNVAKNGMVNFSSQYHGYEDVIILFKEKKYLPVLIEGTLLVDELEANDFSIIKTYELSNSEIKELENSPTESI